MTAQPNGVVNRGQLIALLGVTRLADGAFELAEPCLECGAHRIEIHWERAAGIAGTIHHMADDGCVVSTMSILPAEQRPEAIMKAAEAPKLEVVDKPKPEPGSDDAVIYIQFIHPVEIGENSGLRAWRRKEHAHIAIKMAPPWLILRSSKGRVARVPFANIAYVTEVS